MQALRVHHACHLAHGAVLAAAVHRLEDQQDPLPRASGFGAGIEHFLVPAERRPDVGELRGGPLLVRLRRRTRGARRVDGPEVDLSARRDPQPFP